MSELTQISFLLGSGFSIPDGIPGVAGVNERMRKVEESEIMIHSEQIALFLNGQTDNNRFQNRDARLFFQEFLEFYNQIIIQNGNFNYEEFVDFYSEYQRGVGNVEVIDEFVEAFNTRHGFTGTYTRSPIDRINDFARTFNQLASSLLQSAQYYNDISRDGYHRYSGFISYLGDLLKENIVNVHSLNHDLLFDSMGRTQSKLFQHYCDGFELSGSPYYGNLQKLFEVGDTEETINKSFFVKLASFTDDFSKNLRFVKLHGSVATHIVRDPENGMMPVRVKRDWGIGHYYKEVKVPNSEKYEMKFVWDNVEPDYLSGTTEKIKRYYSDPYYKCLFEHFEENLKKSSALIVIGYGFQDKEINEILERNFLAEGKKMVVIDPGDIQCELLPKFSADHKKNGVTDLDKTAWRNLIPEIVGDFSNRDAQNDPYS